MKKILIFTTFILSFKSFSCDLNISNSDMLMKSWLGTNSNFSKSFFKGKCALDKALNSLSIEERQVIASLIAKSYVFEVKKLDSLKTYNY
tara:strand:+ start:462 stop:731 length:270 start_codon:yes stop_codon:yes gene_type:complete